MIFRFIALLLLYTASSLAWGFSSRTERWSEDAMLHDGRLIKVKREVDWTTRLLLADPFFGLPVLPRFSKSWPDKFWLSFKHPETHETISWQGEQHYRPVLLDIVDGVPYLVVLGQGRKTTEAIYGCPELPYIYLKYESGIFGKWSPVPVEKAPEVLRKANLSPDYPEFGDLPPRMEEDLVILRGGRALRDMSPEDVERKIQSADGRGPWFFQVTIPRSYEEWKYVYKNSHRNERRADDCRPPPKPLPDIPLAAPVDIELEIVESEDYEVRNADGYYKSLWEKTGPITRAKCTGSFRLADPGNTMLGERFVNDPTGNKRLPYSGPIPFPSGRMLETRTVRYCSDEFVWFVAEHEEPGKTIITKFTKAGDFVYSARMGNPNTAANNLYRQMVLDSITAEDSYFYFYWVQNLPRPADSSSGYPNRMTRFRFREPKQTESSDRSAGR